MLKPDWSVCWSGPALLGCLLVRFLLNAFLPSADPPSGSAHLFSSALAGLEIIDQLTSSGLLLRGLLVHYLPPNAFQLIHDAVHISFGKVCVTAN